MGLDYSPSQRDSSIGYLLTEHSENKTPVLGDAIPVLGVKPKRGHVFWLFFLNRHMFSHIVQKISAGALH